MKVEKFNHTYSISANFPNTEMVIPGEGSVFMISKDHPTVLILDQGTMLDFLDEGENIDDVLCTTITTFDSQEERDAYIAETKAKREAWAVLDE